MTITRDNYEPFFLDYLEGNLDENNIDQFLDFLKQNPDLKEELHLFENIHLPEEQVIFTGKEHLYKLAQDENTAFEIKAIAYLEGDLKDEERKSFEAYLADHPELMKEYNLLEKTRLVADTGIQYPDKQKLYRRSGTILVMNWIARAAAVVVIIWGVGSLLQTENQKVEPTAVQEMASVKPLSVPQGGKAESEVKIQEAAIAEKLASKTNPKSINDREQNQVNPEQKPSGNTKFPERDCAVPEEITPLLAQLENDPIDTRLAVSRSINVEKINDPHNIMTIDQFLASQAKKMGDEGLLSVQRIFRTGLSVASELSGDRIGYSVKDGKVSSLDFESKILAFSIPIQKK